MACELEDGRTEGGEAGWIASEARGSQFEWRGSQGAIPMIMTADARGIGMEAVLINTRLLRMELQNLRQWELGKVYGHLRSELFDEAKHIAIPG